MAKKTISEIREEPGKSNAGKYTKVKPEDFAGPNGTYPINTLKRAKSAIKLAHFASNPGNIVKNVLKKYPELKKDKRSPVTYGSNPIKFNSPLYQKDPPKKYKTGGSLAEDKIVDNPKQFARPHDEYSEIQEDKKSQYVTTLAGDERPAGVNWDAKEEKKNIRKRKRSHFVASAGPKTGSRVARDTIRPKKGKKFTKQTRYPNIEKWEKEDLAVQAKRKN